MGTTAPGAGCTWGRPRNDIGDDIGDAGRRGRRPLPCTTSSCRTCRVRDCMVGRDVPGAPRTWRRPRDAHGTTSGTTRGRGPPGTSAPTMYNVLVPNVSRPGLHGRARRPRRAAHMEASTGRTRDDIGDDTGTRAAGDVGPYHVQRPRAECVASGIAWSGAGLARAAMGEGYGREKKSTMRAVLSGSTPWGWWPKSARFSTSTFPPAALRRAAKGSQFSDGRTVWSCPP